MLNGSPRGRHQGADFRAASGTPVAGAERRTRRARRGLCTSPATRSFSIMGSGCFRCWRICHASTSTSGSEVARGDVLGASGATGRVTGPHLHWALRLSEFSVDPLSVVAALSDLKE